MSSGRASVGAALAHLADVRRAEVVALEGLANALATEGPRMVSQRTSEGVLGIPKRLFLELAREFERAGGSVITTGKLRLVDVVTFEGWLRERAKVVSSLTNKDDWAAELGLVEVTP